MHCATIPTAWKSRCAFWSKRDTGHHRDAFRVPMGGAEQRRNARSSRLALSEPQASLARRPARRVAQGTGVAGADPGVAFSLATFFWRSKRKYARQQGGTPSSFNGKSTKPITKPASTMPPAIPVHSSAHPAKCQRKPAQNPNHRPRLAADR